jgi:cytochrome b6-f complex iron-sulfur subunit
MPSSFSVQRRNFLGILATGWIGLISLPMLKGILDYLSPAETSSAQPASGKILALQADQLASNTGKILKLANKPVMLVKTSSGQFKAFSARCTHLGCIVEFVGEPAPHFECHCHGSRFDANGVNIAGPAPRPLDRLKVEVDGNAVYVINV